MGDIKLETSIGLLPYLILVLSDPSKGCFGVGPATFEHVVEKVRAESGQLCWQRK